jgi:putative ABC transport system permease protein
VESLLQDVRYGMRMLRKSPGFTAVAVIAIALGIASTAAIFSVVDQVLLHPLPYPDSDRVVVLGETTRSIGGVGEASSPANYLDWVRENHVFSQMAASRGGQANLTGGDRPERVPTTVTTASFFSLFGVNPILGRPLLREDETPGNDHVVVLSFGLWKRRFGSDRTLVGRDIALDGEQYTVVGVMPPNFGPDSHGELWLPSRWGVPTHPLNPNRDPRQFRGRNYLDVWARLKPGVTLRTARAEMDAIARRQEKQYPQEDGDVGISIVGYEDSVVGDIRPILLVLLTAVGFVLLIVCANVANLMLARATTRLREISIRTALGANRLRLVRQLLTESILLALTGGALGVLLAVWAVPGLVAMSPPDIRDFARIGINRDVLGFSLGVSLLSGILFGLAPALHASRVSLWDSLKQGERGSVGARGSTRSALVVGEIGLSLILLIGSGLLVKSFLRLMRVDPGFNPDHLLVFSLGLPSSSTPAQQDQFYREVVNRLEATAGVESAAAVSRLPLSGGNSSRSFNLPGDSKGYEADIRVSTPDYFKTMGVALLKGRLLTAQDAGSPVQVAVINAAFAHDVFPGQEPMGKYIVNFGPQEEKIQIVGVVGNVRHVGLETAPRPEIYLPFGQAHWPSAFVVVRSKVSDPLALISASQSAVWSVNRDIPLANVRSMQDVIAGTILRRKFAMLLVSIFGGLAMLLAAIGLYGVMSYSVSERTQELGIRMALGAGKADVLALIVEQGMRLAVFGLLLGLLVSIVITKLMSGLLFEVSARDPLVIVVVAVLLGGVALLANVVPAQRATKVEPLVALRNE